MKKKLDQMMSIVTTNKAVSPVLGMILILGIVVTSVGLIYTVGMPKIESAKEQAQMETMRSNFVVLQTDIKDIVQSPSTGRVTKMQLETGSVAVYSANESINGTGYIEYNAGGKIIAYENGAVFAKYPQQDYAEVVSDPIMYVDVDADNNTHVYIHCLIINGSKAVAGTGPAYFDLRPGEGNITYRNLPMTNVTFNITSNFHRGWHDYFEKILDDAGLVEGAAGAADYTLSAETVNPVTVFVDGKNHTMAEQDVLLYAVETEVRVQ